MPIFKAIANKLAHRRFKKLNQTKTEALIDALAGAKAIDGKLLPVERAELVEISQKLEWEGAQPKETYVDQSVEKATALDVSEETLVGFFSEIGERLGEDWLREEAYYLCSRVVLADDVIDEKERLFLQYLVKGFDIDPKRQALIIRKIREEM